MTTSLAYLDFGLIGDDFGRCVRLPSYPWRLSRYWLGNLAADVPEPNLAEL